MKSVWFRALLPVCLLATIVFICFGRSLASYFLADDFSDISNMARIFNGDYNMLLGDFIGNQMGTVVMKVYRPVATLALLLKYAIWGTNAWGYFLTNILNLLASAVLLFLLLRELTKSWSYNRSIAFAFLSAALFAANPLHCEPVSFVAAGDYLVSAFFYLLTLWCLLKNIGTAKRGLLALGVASFWMAILCKEAAVGLALVLSGIVFFLPYEFNWQKNNRQSEFADKTSYPPNYPLSMRLKLAMAVSMPLWLGTAAYLILRLVVLGTVTGGYTAGLGSTLTSSLIQRLTNPDTILHIAYPLNESVFGTTSVYGSILFTIYVALATCIVLKFVLKTVSWDWIGLIVLWSFSTIAPLYQVWSMGANLEGARIFFFLTIPLSILLPAVLLAPTRQDSGKSLSLAIRTELKAIEAVSVMSLLALLIVDITVTYNNNIPWVHAGRQTKACMIQGQKLAQSVPFGKKFALLGLPQEYEGAHEIYNGGTFNIMMSRPFSQKTCADKFITFCPIFYNSPGLVNSQRLKMVLLDDTVAGLYSWNTSKLKFEQLRKPSKEELLDSQSTNQEIIQLTSKPIESLAPSEKISIGNQSQLWMQQGANTTGLVIAPLNLNPYNYDFIEIASKSPCPKLVVSLYWEGTDTKAQYQNWSDLKNPVRGMINPAPSGLGNIRIRVSDHWRWYTQGNISKLRLDFLPGQGFELLNVRALPGRFVVPTIAVSGSQASNIGVYQIDKSGVDLNFDGSTVNGCVAVKIEVSKPNYFFEGLTSTQESSAIMSTITIPVNKGNTHIPGSIFTSPGYYQLRAVCLSGNNSQVGVASDPVTLSI